MQLLPPPAAKSETQSELSTALASCRSAFVATAVFSGMSNVLMLTGAIFMLEIYDRVLPSHSVPTLVALVAIAAALYAALGVLDLIRSRILVRVGASLDEAISDRVYDALVCMPLKAGNRGDGLQALRHLDNLRTFLSGMGPIAFFDLPWIPLYLVICFVFHPLIGITALVGAIILCVLTLLTEVYTRDSSKQVIGLAASRTSLAETSRRNAEALVAMGMNRRLGARWRETNRKFIASQQQTSDVASGFASISKVLRMLLQSAVLAVGAWLVINQQATAGIIIAGSILSARALAPVDLAIAHWKGFIAARQSWQALNQLLALFPAQKAPMSLPVPGATLTVDGACAAPPGTQRLVASNINFVLNAGNGLGIIGPSGSGKSSSCAASGWRLATGARPHLPRWRHLRSMVRRSAWRAHRLSAAGRRAFNRNDRREHCALCTGCALRDHHRGREGRGRA